MVVTYSEDTDIFNMSLAFRFKSACVACKTAQGSLTSLELLLLSAWEYAGLSLVCTPVIINVSAFAGQKAKPLKLLIQSTDYITTRF